MSELQKWELLKSDQLFIDNWVDIRVHAYKKSDGTIIKPYYVFGYPDFTTALAITKEGKVIALNVYRPALDCISLEIPGGCMDPSDKTPEDAIARELLEETGYRFEKIESLGCLSPNPSTNTNMLRMFLATGGVFDAAAVRDLEESIEVVLLEWDDFINKFKSQCFLQAMHNCNIFYALMKMNKLTTL